MVESVVCISIIPFYLQAYLNTPPSHPAALVLMVSWARTAKSFWIVLWWALRKAETKPLSSFSLDLIRLCILALQMENTRKFSILHHPGSLALLNDIILFIKEGKKRGGGRQNNTSNACVIRESWLVESMWFSCWVLLAKYTSSDIYPFWRILLP